jgi:hypothetical protein
MLTEMTEFPPRSANAAAARGDCGAGTAAPPVASRNVVASPKTSGDSGIATFWSRRPNRAMVFGWLSVVPLLTWWLGWFPGFLSPDSIDQLGQIDRFSFTNVHPITHTFSMWVITRVWDDPGAVTLVQVVLLAGVLGYTARRLTGVGIPWWLSGAVAVMVGAIPMVGATAVTIWKDIPFSTVMLWTFAELLLLARDRAAFWAGSWGPLRLGIAFGFLWILRANGAITVVIMLVALAIAFRDRWRRLLPTAVATFGVALLVPAVLLWVLPGTAAAIEPAEVFMPDLAAVVAHDPDWFDYGDLGLIEAVGPLSVWTGTYDCDNSTPMLFDPQFNSSVARGDPWAYRGLVARAVLTHIPTVAGHRWCAASYLIWPVQPDNAFIQRPPFEIPPNTLGIARDPISDRAYHLTLAEYQWVERSGVIWLTWRPALVTLLGLVTYLGIVVRPTLRPLLWGGALILAHLFNVALTTPATEFRYAYGVYLISLMSLTLWWLIIRPQDQEGAGNS